MPARGWENFVNSNLGGARPAVRGLAGHASGCSPPPTRGPSPAAGLHQALEQGRGADWVIYHSCLAHQPIFLTRRELGEMPRLVEDPSQPFQTLQPA